MIDFRYHLVSIVAVLLALGVGLVVGSGFIGGPLLDDIEQRAEDIRDSNERLRSDLAERRDEIEQQSAFAEEASRYLLDNRLNGVAVVLVEADGVGGAVSDNVAQAISAAGGEVVTTIELHDRFSLEDDLEVDELALALGSVQEDPDEIRNEAAATLGSLLAGASASEDRVGAQERLGTLLTDLEEAEFITVTATDDGGSFVVAGSRFVLLGGSDEESPFQVDDFFLTVSLGLVGREQAVVVAEPLGSTWGLVSGVLADSEARSSVSTASGVEHTAGSIAAAMALGGARNNRVDHVGLGSEASSVLPEPTTSPPPGE